MFDLHFILTSHYTGLHYIVAAVGLQVTKTLAVQSSSRGSAWTWVYTTAAHRGVEAKQGISKDMAPGSWTVGHLTIRQFLDQTDHDQHVRTHGAQ